MNLDQQLRAALSQEAEMTIAPPPDLTGIIEGGQARRRNRRVAWGGGIAAAVIAAGGLYGAVQLTGDDPATPPVASDPGPGPVAGPPPAYVESDSGLEPGTYRKPVGSGESGDLAADLTFTSDEWEANDHALLTMDTFYGGTTAYVPDGFPKGDSGCAPVTDPGAFPREPAARTVDGIVAQLSSLPRASVTRAAAAVTAYGTSAVSLQVTIDDNCTEPGTAYCVAKTAFGYHGVTYAFPTVPVVLDVVVLEVDGVVVVAESWWQSESPESLVEESLGVRDSMSFVVT